MFLPTMKAFLTCVPPQIHSLLNLQLLTVTAPATAANTTAKSPKPINIDKIYDHVYDWIIDYGPRFLIGIAILFIGLWAINRFVKWSQNRMHKRNVDPSVKPFLLSILGVALRILLVLGVMQIVGIQITLFATIIGAMGVAAGLALSGTLQNFASGILILLLKPFVVNDSIVTQGIEGNVTSIQIFYTVITTYDNRTVIVPNSQLSNQVITNNSRGGNRRLDLAFKFPLNIDVKDVKKVISDAIDKSKDCLKIPDRRIGVADVQPDGYVISVNVWVNAHGFQDTKLAVLEIILETLKSSGLKLPGL